MTTQKAFTVTFLHEEWEGDMECLQWGTQCIMGKGEVWYLSDGNRVVGKDFCGQVDLE